MGKPKIRPAYNVQILNLADLNRVVERLSGEKVNPEELRAVYRGQNAEHELLQPKADREPYVSNLARFQVIERRRTDVAQSIRAYKRMIHNKIAVSPGETEWLEWAAMIQHYGGPTSLLDVTDSPWVALYFASEDFHKDKGADLWCIRHAREWEAGVWDKHIKTIKKLVRGGDSRYANPSHELRGGEIAETMAGGFGIGKRLLHYLHDNEDYEVLVGDPRFTARDIKALRAIRQVMLVRPFKLNARLLAQQGRFAIAANYTKDIATSFMENLLPEKKDLDEFSQPQWLTADKFLAALDEKNYFRVARFRLAPNLLIDLRDILRRYNLTGHTLYPDFEGWTRTLGEIQRNAKLHFD